MSNGATARIEEPDVNAQSQVISLDEYRARRLPRQAAPALAPAAGFMPMFYCWAPVWVFVPAGAAAPSW